MIYHLGPVGDLRELPPIERDQKVDATTDAPGAEHVSLGGRRTRDRTGRPRRVWTLPWLYLTGTEADLLADLADGLLGEPLWLVDPSRPNLLPRHVATASTQGRSADRWEVTGGTRRWVRLDERPPGVRAAGAVEWQGPDAPTPDGASTGHYVTEIELTTGRSDRTARCPLTPSVGRVVTASWARCVAGGPVQVQAGIDAFTVDDLRGTTRQAPVTVGPEWVELYTHQNVVPLGVEVAPCWSIPAGQPSATVQIAGVRLGYGEVAPAPSSGGGAAQVYVRSLTESRPDVDEFDMTMTVVEA